MACTVLPSSDMAKKQELRDRIYDLETKCERLEDALSDALTQMRQNNAIADRFQAMEVELSKVRRTYAAAHEMTCALGFDIQTQRDAAILAHVSEVAEHMPGADRSELLRERYPEHAERLLENMREVAE